MGKRQKSVASIDFGSYSIKIVVGSTDGQQVSVNKAVMIPIPEDTYMDGQFKKPEIVRDILKGTLHDNHISGIPAICTMESSLTVIREMSLPVVKPKELKEMISYEIQNYLPIELSQYVVQSKAMGETLEGGTRQTNVMVAAMPRDIVETHLAAIEAVGLKPYAMDIHSNSQFKLFGGSRKVNQTIAFKDQTIALIDIGHRQINMNLIERGRYRFNRLLNIGSRDIDEQIANFTTGPLEAARMHKNEITDIHLVTEDLNDEARYRSICRSVADTWMDEVERIFKYYTSRSSSNRIDMILLMGGGANLKGLDQYIQKMLSIPTACISSIDGIQASGIPGNLDLMKFTNAVGAMIRL